MSRRSTRRAGAAILTTVLIAGVSATACDDATASTRPELRGDHVLVPIAGGRADVDTASLSITGVTGDGARLAFAERAPGGLGAPGPIRITGDLATWTYPDRGLTVSASADAGRLRVVVHSDRDTRLAWPMTGADPAAAELELPRGEGLSLPVADPFWNSPDAALVGDPLDLTAGLTMPFWGYRIADRGVSYLVPTDLGTTLTVTSADGKLRATAEHEFAARAGTRDYTVTFALTDASPVAPARDYRAWLVQHGEFRSLTEKLGRNPAISRLLGAFHAYLWGDGRTPEAIHRMRELGLSRMWLGYDAGDDPMSRAAVDAAKQAGYLAGPYDSYANAQDPATADNPASRWPDGVWPTGCVHDADGTPKTGFGDRGCYLSSQALKQDPRLLADRYASMTANGANTYFLDVDAAGEFFDDHTPEHPMNQRQDRDNRLARLRALAEERGQVLGSESAGAWASTVLAYSHGSQTPVSDLLWKAERDKETWGGWAPERAPRSFFQPAELPAAAAEAMFDPAYRVPLYETVLHDSVINLDRWELSYYKLPRQQTMRALTAILNNTPLNLVLDQHELSTHGAEIARLQQYFAPLHEAAGTTPMTEFRRLTADRLVQRSTFGDGTLTVTANFGTETYDDLPGGCVDAKLATDSTPRRLCPGR
ncbi:glycosyl hydrolase family 101 [Nocardia tenerifensis]|uniref:Glycosyl hydrolase family 101 n=1 Tax=Nocardia tenerifensis TaxID=228006 RepID=A0A318KA74_9NOCA|nr:glycoside hydrolase [Nocardia tenerifensis]PXX52856.1 glycosyl hydrolase family 101 [Nocardia tenerifensis]